MTESHSWYNWYTPKSHTDSSYRLSEISLVMAGWHQVGNVRHPAVLMHIGGMSHAMVFEGDNAISSRDTAITELRAALGKSEEVERYQPTGKELEFMVGSGGICRSCNNSGVDLGSGRCQCLDTVDML